MATTLESLKLRLELAKINTTLTLLTYVSLYGESASGWLHSIAESAEMSLWSRGISAEGLVSRIREAETDATVWDRSQASGGTE